MSRRAYWRYVLAQVVQAWAKRHKPPHAHMQRLAGLIAPDDPILCVGARNGQEVEAWEALGHRDVRAVDLLPSWRVRRADFHALPYDDDSFSLLYASHAYEHAFDPWRALEEAARVLRVGGYLFAAFPRGFTPSEHDRHDYRDAEGFLAHTRPGVQFCLIWQRLTPTEAACLFRLEEKGGKS